MNIKRLAIGIIFCFTNLTYAGNEGGGGGDTYLSQMKESFIIGARMMKESKELSGVSATIIHNYKKHRDNWIKRLESDLKVTESKKELLVDNLKKAAIANDFNNTIEISQPYWSKHPVSMIQSIVLAIHETGHLEKIDLSHRELDELGTSLTRQYIMDSYGSLGWEKISTEHARSAPHKKISCVMGSGEFPFYVFDNERSVYLSNLSYRTLDLCKQATNTRDSRIICVPVNASGGGSAIFYTQNQSIVGYKNYYYTSVEYCSQAIQSARGNTVCIPSGNGSIVFDFVKGQIIGNQFRSVEHCKGSSLSASNRDSFICALNSWGSWEILNRQTKRWLGQAYGEIKGCSDFLMEYRNQ